MTGLLNEETADSSIFGRSRRSVGVSLAVVSMDIRIYP